MLCCVQFICSCKPIKVPFEKIKQLNPKYEYKEETPMRKNGDEQEIPSEDEYSKLSKVCSPLAVSLGRKMQKTQKQGYLTRAWLIFRLYNWREDDPNFPPVLLFPCERLTGLCVYNVAVLLQPVIYRQRLLG